RVLSERLPAKELQRRGVCLLKLQISNCRTGLYGRTLVTFEPSGNSTELPSHNITPGGQTAADVVGSGVVTRVSKTIVTVAFDDKEDIFSLNDEGRFRLTKLTNDVTYKRLKSALHDLQKQTSAPCTRLISALFGERELTPPYQKQDIHFVNQRLDESQREAVTFALSQPEVAVVHGPPGTGKTTTVIEIIIQAVKQGNKVLACAPSNIAVDNLVERLGKNRQKVIRLGHPARVLPHIQKYSLDAVLASSDETKIVEDVRKDLDKALAALRKTRDKGEKQKLRGDLKYLRKELVQREEAAIKELLNRADVVVATLTTASLEGPIKFLDEDHFGVAVIDECSQAVEAACWIALQRAPRCILAGDHLQLPPTILNVEAAKDGLEKTLMERIIDLYDKKVVRMLTTQYRMHRAIMTWSSEVLYHGKLEADPSVEGHLLRDLHDVTDCEVTQEPLLLVDTAGCELYELDTPEEVSKGNEGEADIISFHVKQLIDLGVGQEDIAVIAPYNLQVELLRLRLSSQYPKLEIKSVDGFQGREKEAVLISMVRSNPKGEVGFLSEKRRINVAVTRARRHLMVVCDSETVGRDEFLKSLIEYMSDHGEVKTAQEYIDNGVLNGTSERPEHLADLLSLSVERKSGSARQKSTNQNRGYSNKKSGKLRSKPEDKENKPEYKPKTEEETNERIKEFQGYLDNFVVDASQDCMEFPATLNSHDRMLVHELAEKLGLVHISKGVGKERFIVVSKPGAEVKRSDGQEGKVKGSQGQVKEVKKKDIQQCSKDGNKEKINTDVDIRTVEKIHVEEKENYETVLFEDKISDKITCKHCSKPVIKANFPLHEIHCARRQKETAKSAKEAKSGQQVKSKRPGSAAKKVPNAHSDVTAKLGKVDPDDFDALIATAQTMDQGCAFKKCKTKTITLGHMCEFCGRRFCLSHHTPEVHGCGDAAKSAARAAVIREGVLYRGSGVPDKLPDPDRKARLQKRMDQKLSEMSAKRQGKKNKK
ncbi:hypothetical protein FSP39_012679, partial [Pinctada imbricata]